MSPDEWLATNADRPRPPVSEMSYRAVKNLRVGQYVCPDWNVVLRITEIRRIEGGTTLNPHPRIVFRVDSSPEYFEAAGYRSVLRRDYKYPFSYGPDKRIMAEVLPKAVRNRKPRRRRSAPKTHALLVDFLRYINQTRVTEFPETIVGDYIDQQKGHR